MIWSAALQRPVDIGQEIVNKSASHDPKKTVQGHLEDRPSGIVELSQLVIQDSRS